MKSAVILLTLALASLVLAGILPRGHTTPNPNDIFKKVQFRPLNALDYADPEVEVSISLVHSGIHGIALSKARILYPYLALYPVQRCRYNDLGFLRFYTFGFKLDGEVKEVKTAVEASDAKPDGNVTSTIDSKDGFLQISAEWAQQDPRISVALKYVIKANWQKIEGRPLIGCWSKPIEGLYIYRFYFKDIEIHYEYHQSSKGVTIDAGSDRYFSNKAPVLSVNISNSSNYVEYLVDQIEKHPAFDKIKKLFEKQLGFFDKNWIIKYAGLGTQSANTLKLVVNFQPFLLEQHYEVYYYGDSEKASLLKVDEQIFNDGTSYQNWKQIQNFGKFKAFKQAHEYILSQFSWMRFYKVKSAYAALHKKGRFVRLVLQGIAEQNIDAGQQINIVTYIDEKGCYFIDRNDFHATHLNSYGRNDWISIFVKTPNLTQAKYYQKIVKFHKDIYPKFWSQNQMTDIKFKDNLHVIKFQNPTNTNTHHNVLQITDKETKLLTKLNWTKLSETSPLKERIEKYVRGRNSECGKIMFVHLFKDSNGTHFQVSYLDTSNAFKVVYILYIQDTDVFSDNKFYTFNAVSFDKSSLPADVKASVVAFLAKQDISIIAVAGFVSLSPTSYAVIGVSLSGRWQINVEWKQGKWVVVSKQPYNEGFYKAQGYPSDLAASATGFITKLFPKQMGEGYVYASIETKSVGLAIYIRLVYKIKDIFVEAVIQKTYGVNNSDILYSWKIINGVKDLHDYGYGVDYSFDYKIDKALLYQDDDEVKVKPTNLKVEKAPLADNLHVEVPRSRTTCAPGTRREMFTGGCMVVF